jgi:protein-S-isoprenylcysteine O-methyltransferase Ste14
MLYIKSLLLTILIPGAVVVLIPYFIVSWGGLFIFQGWGVLQIAGIILVGIGVAILLHCSGMFAWVGRGTLAPFDPPELLVVRGLYRYSRNPMYAGVLMMLSGESLFFESVSLLVYTVVWFGLINLVVVAYEEPTLRGDFGESYGQYCRTVHRWLPVRPGQQVSIDRG